MSNTNDNPLPEPETSRLADGGASIVVWLIFGSALLVAFMILWEARSSRHIKAEAAGVEEAVRRRMGDSFRLLRENRPRAVIEADADIAKGLEWLERVRPNGYKGLRAARLFILSEALLHLGGEDARMEAEKDFTAGLDLLERASGEVWELGMYGRGKARYKLGWYALAIEDFDSLIAYNPSYGAAYYWRHLAKTARGDVKGAAEDEAHAKALGSWPPPDAL